MSTEYPAIGFGTYPLRRDICYQAVSDALRFGYRIIDTATYYQNFDPIARAIKKVNRADLHIISKVWPDAHTKQGIFKDIEMTLSSLQTDYLDTYLLHWPNSTIPIEESLLALQAIQQKGLIRHIGLSNVTVHHLRRALEVNVPIHAIQNEMNPLFYDKQLLTMCHANAIQFQAWGPLARGRVREDVLLQRLANKYNKTECQIALAWICQHQALPLPGSSNPKHIQLNLACSEIKLTSAEMEEINQQAMIGARERIVPEWGLGFSDEFDFTYEECWPR